MSIVNIPSCLESLASFLYSLDRRATVEELQHHLENLDVTREDLEQYANFGDACYRRNIICENEWFELLCICWRSGQRSPIHNHAGSTCGLRIIEGIATETVFEQTASGQIKPVKSVDFDPCLVCSTQDEEIHQVSNLQSPDQKLMTLHIYSPPLKTMDTFSLLNDEVGTYRVKDEYIEYMI